MKKNTAAKGKAGLVKARPPQPEASFAEVLRLIQGARQRAYQAVNSELVALYWQVGEYISRKIVSKTLNRVERTTPPGRRVLQGCVFLGVSGAC